MKRFWYNGFMFKKILELEIYCSRNEILYVRKYYFVFISGFFVNYIVQIWSKDDSVCFEKLKYYIYLFV